MGCVARLSGKDERKLLDTPECPNCQYVSRYWALGEITSMGIHKPLCHIYSKEHSLAGGCIYGKPGTTVSFGDKPGCVADIEDKIAYAWCNECNYFHKDVSFVRNVVNIAKRLEKLGCYV